MSIRSINPYGPQRPISPSTTAGAAVRSTPAGGVPAVGATSAGTAAPRQDTVSISDAARSLAGGRTTAADTAAARPALTSERVAELRKKVLEGAYNSTHAADAVAKRLLASGDV